MATDLDIPIGTWIGKHVQCAYHITNRLNDTLSLDVLDKFGVWNVGLVVGESTDKKVKCCMASY